MPIIAWVAIGVVSIVLFGLAKKFGQPVTLVTIGNVSQTMSVKMTTPTRPTQMTIQLPSDGSAVVNSVTVDGTSIDVTAAMGGGGTMGAPALTVPITRPSGRVVVSMTIGQTLAGQIVSNLGGNVPQRTPVVTINYA